MRLCEFPGGNRQAERWKSQGATLASRLCEFPGLAPLSGFGTEAERALWAEKRGGASGNGKERLRDYSVSRPEIPQRSHNAKRSKKKAVRERSVS